MSPAKPTCHHDCGACPHQSDPASCIEATSGEQGETAEMLEIARLRRELAAAREDLLVAEGNHSVDREDHEAELAKLRSELAAERGQKKSDLLQDLAATRVALRDLIASVTATKTRNTIVLRDIEAARAVLEGKP